MATGPSTQIADVIVPEIFTPYMQQMSEEKTRLIQSGVLTRSTMLDGFLAGGGRTFDMPSWKPLDNDADNVSTDAVPDRIAATVADAWPSSSLKIVFQGKREPATKLRSGCPVTRAGDRRTWLKRWPVMTLWIP